MAVVEAKVARKAPAKNTGKKVMARRPANGSQAEQAQLAEHVRALAWAGQHAQAIDLATQHLGSGTKFRAATQVDLLDLRAESYIAQGKLDLAAKDAAAMVKLAKAGPKSQISSLQAKALNRKALVQMRMGELRAAVRTARSALRTAQGTGQKRVIARGLLHLGEAQFLTQQNSAAVKNAGNAVELFQELGDTSAAGRASWVLAFALAGLNLTEQSRGAGRAALDMGRQVGDQYGVGNALYILAVTEAGEAERIMHLHQAQQAFQAAGYVERQAEVLGGLALTYGILGMYRRSQRLQEEIVEMTRAIGAKPALTSALGNLIWVELTLGAIQAARGHIQEHESLVAGLGDPIQDVILLAHRSELAFVEGDLRAAIRQQQSAVKAAREGHTGLEHTTLTGLARVQLAAGQLVAALKATTRATELHRAQAFAPPNSFPSQEIWWRHAQALNANRKTREAREALERAHSFLLESITNIRDVGLRRNALNKVEVNRELIQFWVKDGAKRKLPKERLFAHLNIESSLREPFERLAETSLRLNTLKTAAEIRSFLVEEATELSGGERVMLILEKDAKPEVVESLLPRGEDAGKVLASIKKYLAQARLTRTLQLSVPSKRRSKFENQKSKIIAPLITQNQILGYLYVDTSTLYGTFDETDRDMLGMLANQGAVALDNAELLEGLERKVEERTAELSQSNKIQTALYKIANAASASHDLHEFYRSIHEVIGDLMYAENFFIALYDQQTDLITWPYYVDTVDIESPPPEHLGEQHGVTAWILKHGQPLHRGIADALLNRGDLTIVGTSASDGIGVPLKSEAGTMGVILVQSYLESVGYQRQDVDVLTFVAQHISTALTRARALEAERQRAAELAVINSIQEGLARELDLQGIVDLIGEKVGEIFKADTTLAFLLDVERDTYSHGYYVDRGKRTHFQDGPVIRPSLGAILSDSGRPLLLGTLAESEALGAIRVASADSHVDRNESYLGVPILAADKVIGIIAVQSYKQHAYSDSDLRLLQTLANAMSLALQNAQSFKAEQERVSELAIINSVQEGLAKELDLEGIVDLIGAKVGEIFKADTTVAFLYDQERDWVSNFCYMDRGARTPGVDGPLTRPSLAAILLETRRPLLLGTADETVKLGAIRIASAGEEVDKNESYLGVPILATDKAIGVIAVQSYQQNAYGESDLRLLQTLANGMSVALQNAQSFRAEQERVAELQIINSIQQGLAAELDFQAIVDLVGDKLREVFSVPDLGIRWYDPKTNLMHFLYEYEHGKRMFHAPSPPTSNGLFETMVRTRQPIVANTVSDHEKLEIQTIPGTDSPKSTISVPIISSDRVLGGIVMWSAERENAFGQSELRLLTTIAASLGTALENARLFDETQRLLKETEERNAELAVINSVQAALAAELNIQGIYDAVGDKIREIFHQGDVGIRVYDPKTNLVHFPYFIDDGARVSIESHPLRERGFAHHMIRNRETLVVNENMARVMERYGSRVLPGTVPPKSQVLVPLVVGDQGRGLIQIMDKHREHAFSDSDVRLLETLANAMSVALENARLFDETQRLLKITEDRAAELAIINSVQEGLASKLDFKEIIELVGEQIEAVFSADVVGIGLYDHRSGMAEFPYLKDHGERYFHEPRPMYGAFEYLLRAPRPILIRTHDEMVQFMAEHSQENLGGPTEDNSHIIVPMLSGTQPIGIVTIGKLPEYAFGESDVRLLQTLANSMSVALENARLFDEGQKKNAEISESLERETASNDILRVIAESPTDIQPVLDVIARNAAQLSGSDDALITLRSGDLLRVDAHYGDIPTFPAGEGIPFNRDSVVGRAIIEGEPRQAIHKWRGKSEYPEGDRAARKFRYRATCSVPLMRQGKAIGAISIRRIKPELLTDKQIALVQSFASQAAIAVENVRLFEAEQERVAELQIINSVQAALAAELNIQGIYDAVGDKIREIFHNSDLSIRIYDPKTDMVHFPYACENGERITVDSTPLLHRGFTSHVLRTRETVVINENAPEASEKYGSYTIPGTASPKSDLFVPLVVGDQARGLINLSDYQREHAFSDSDVRLLQTLANSMSVALENARLFDETQRLLKETEERNAELAVINSVQAALAAELNIQGIYDAVGDKIREIFHSTDLGIRIYDPKTNLVHFPYGYENGQRVLIESMPLPERGFTAHLVRTRETLVINENALQAMEEYGSYILPGTAAMSKSAVFVPLVVGDQARGSIELHDMEHEHAFSDSDVRLLQTLANSMSVALENARLFDETQRLLKETEQRAAELQIINAVQQGLASKLEMQAIYDLVGDKIRDIFDTQAVLINTYDRATGLAQSRYVIERGQRFHFPEPAPLSEFAKYQMQTRETVLINEDADRRARELHMNVVPGTENPKSMLFVPLIVGDEVRGVISLQNIDRENAFSESDVRLLQTLASAMSVSLESARLFDETQRLLKETEQRNAELAIINSVQDALAQNLDIQTIYDSVGDKLQEIFDAQTVLLVSYDRMEGHSVAYYVREKGERFYPDPLPLSELHKNVIRSRRTLVINENANEELTKLGAVTIPGTEIPLSAVFVPLLAGRRVSGMISLQNVEREHAFPEAQVRLLETLASSMSVALENARLFDETQRLLKETEQRNAELAVINSVQQGVSTKLDFQAIIDLVGDKLREVLHTTDLAIAWYDGKANLAHQMYVYEHGLRLTPPPPSAPKTKAWLRMIETRQPVVVNTLAESLDVFGPAIAGTDESKSIVRVPIIGSDRIIGSITVEDFEREYAYSESDVRLLQTVASSMGVALENARLFEETTRLLKETEQRNAELAIINKVQEGLASKLEMQAIYDLVGDEVRSLFDAQAVLIVTYDRAANLFHYPYMIEKGERIAVASTAPMGFSARMIETRQPILIKTDFVEHYEEITGRPFERFAGEQPKSWLGVPLLVGDEVRGTISLQNVDREEAYSEADLRLLNTLAGTMSVALENARLFDETQRLLKETEQRAAELAVINSIQEGVAASLDFQTIIDLVGDKLRQVLGTGEIGIRWYDYEHRLVHYLYEYEHGQRLTFPPRPPAAGWDALTKQREPLMSNTAAEVAALGILPGTDSSKSGVKVAIVGSDRVLGQILVENYEREYAFGESDVRLLTTVASSMGVALENARLFDETQRLFQAEQQRAQELAIITSVQQGLASKLDVQGIVELVGDKICSVFGTQDMFIGLLDRETGLINYPYGITAGVRDSYPAVELGKGLSSHVIRTGAPLVINTDMERRSAELGAIMDRARYREIKSWVGVPIVIGKQAIGLISLQDVTRENAFGDAQVDLLGTLSNAMSLALENARLFDETARLLQETEHRASELAIINSVGQVLTQQLDLQVMIDLVGDRLRDALATDNIGIGLYDEATNLLHPAYVYHEKQRVHPEPRPLSPLTARLSKSGQTLVINQGVRSKWKKYGSNLTIGTRVPKSVVMVPIIAGSKLIGGITMQSFERENAYPPAVVGLLETVAANMGTAMESARLFDETQRLFREEQQRAAELAIINSVQEGLAAKLDMQAIYDLVGDKVCEIFSLQTCYIMIYDQESDTEFYPYVVEDGVRLQQDPIPHDEKGFGPLVMRTRQPVMINEDMERRGEEVGSYLIGGSTDPKSAIYVPLLIGSQAKGVISVQNTQRENAFTDSDLRLLNTLASSMSVALESARLFAETEQRAGELAIINGVQQGLASKLETRAIYDLVGEKLRQLFENQAISVVTFDLERNTYHYEYLVEKGQRVQVPDGSISPTGQHLIRTRQTLLVNQNIVGSLAGLGIEMQILPGTETPRSLLRVPILIAGRVVGYIGLSNLDRENAFSSSDVRLLQTLADSLSVALESARLFAETEQRAQELAIINSVQQGLASKLEVRAIYDLVGDKLRQLFDTQAINLVSFDLEKNSVHYHYIFERGQRFDTPDVPITSLSGYVIRSREPLLVNERISEALAALGIDMKVVPGTEPPKAILRVPILIGGRVHGAIGLDNLDHENAFSPSDVRLLQTLAGSLSVALESARLFEETKRNAAELATVNTVSSALATELDISTLIELVGEQIRSIFRAEIAYVALLDETGETITFPYVYGEEVEPMKYGEGLTGKIIETGRPVLINAEMDRETRDLGATSVGLQAQSYLGVPILLGGKAVGVVSVESTSHEDAFDENSQRLLTTIAANVSSALHNAQLYREAQESRAAAEQANRAKSTFLANMSHELRTPLNAIIGFTRIVRRKADGALPDKQIENLDKVLASSEHLLGLINTVLDIAKIEAGRLDVIPANFNIGSLADQCANLSAPLLKPGVSLNRQVDESLGLIYSDQDKIKQIVLNLLSNAAKFTHKGSILLSVDRRDDESLNICVTDTGIGISEEALNRIFEEFQQADTSTTRMYGGTGLGLAISRSLARLLGGDLTATSELGAGSTFTLTLPIKYGTKPVQPSAPEVVRAGQAVPAEQAGLPGRTVLVIDDDPDAIYLLQESIDPNEFKVVGSRNGHDGLRFAREQRPDAILLDILMPEVDGWQVLNDLKEDPATDDIPVILLTIVDKKALGFRLGAAAYLLKPLDPVVVLEALRRVIGEKGHPPKHVLVVDDDPTVAEMLAQILAAPEFALESAADGEEGLRVISARRPDIILLDLMMPKLDGFGVIERLRADPATRDIPIIVISAKDLTEPESRKLRESVAFVMKKQGFDGQKLMEELNSALHP